MKSIQWFLVSVVSLTLAACGGGPSDAPWVRLHGGTGEEAASALVVGDDGSVFVGGHTQGTIEKHANRGGMDAFVAKYSTGGDLQWHLPLASDENEEVRALAVGPNGDLFAAGYTRGDLKGDGSPKDDQIFVAKISSGGKLQWLNLYGETTAAPVNALKESAEGIAVSSDGSLFIAGFTVQSFGKVIGETADRDVFLVKLDSEGAVVDAKLIGTPRDEAAHALALTSEGALYLAGYTEGSLGEDQGQANAADGVPDAFLLRIGPGEGDFWIRLLGTSQRESAQAVAVSPTTGEVFMGGTASNGLTGKGGRGLGDGFVAKYTAAGELVWTQLVGGKSIDTVEGLAVGKTGTLFVTGSTWSDLAKDGAALVGRSDAYLAALSPEGAVTKVIQQTGADEQALGKGLRCDGAGQVYVAGRSGGAFGDAAGQGGSDALLWKVRESELSPGQ